MKMFIYWPLMAIISTGRGGKYRILILAVEEAKHSFIHRNESGEFLSQGKELKERFAERAAAKCLNIQV